VLEDEVVGLGDGAGRPDVLLEGAGAVDLRLPLAE